MNLFKNKLAFVLSRGKTGGRKLVGKKLIRYICLCSIFCLFQLQLNGQFFSPPSNRPVDPTPTPPAPQVPSIPGVTYDYLAPLIETREDQPIVNAVRRGNIKRVRQYIVNGKDINATAYTTGATLLTEAIVHNQLDIAKLLIDNKVSLRKKDTSKFRALHYAAATGNLDAVDLLIEYGATVDPDDILLCMKATRRIIYESHQPTINVYIEIYETLLRNGATIDQFKNMGQTSILRYFKGQQAISFIRFLLKKGCDINGANRGGYTLLMQVLQQKDEEDKIKIMRFMLGNGADINAQNTYQRNILMQTLMESELAEKPKIIHFLVKKGVDLNAQDNKGKTFLLQLIERKTELPKKNIIYYLIKNGADVNIQDHESKTASMYCLTHFQPPDTKKMIQLLLKYGADINAKDKHNNTLLLLVINKYQGNDFLDFLKYLLEQGAHINIDGIKHTTPLIATINKMGDRDDLLAIIESLFLKKDADINFITNGSETALSAAFRVKRFDLVNLLLKYHANINAKSHDGSHIVLKTIGSNKSYSDLSRYKQNKMHLQLERSLQNIKNKNATTQVSIMQPAVEPYKKWDTLIRYLFEKKINLSGNPNKKGLSPIDYLFQIVQNYSHGRRNGKDLISIFPIHQTLNKQEMSLFLYHAIKFCDLEQLKGLLQKNSQQFNPSFKHPYYGQSLLHTAIIHKKLDITDYFITNKADLTQTTLMPYSHYSFDRIVNRGLNSYSRNTPQEFRKKEHTYTPLMLAIRTNNVKLYRALKRKGAIGSPEDRLGLSIAIEFRANKVIREILKHVPNLNRYIYDEKPIIFQTVKHSQVEAYKLLKKAGANIHATDNNGNTLITYYLIRLNYGHPILEQYDFLKQLVNSKIDLTAKNNEGKTAADYAKNHQMRKILGISEQKNRRLLIPRFQTR